MRARTDSFPDGSNAIARRFVHVRRSRPGRRTPTLGRHSRYPRQDSGGDLPGTVAGSHMPLDTRLYWRWHNPLNVIPLLILVAVALAVAALIA